MKVLSSDQIGTAMECAEQSGALIECGAHAGFFYAGPGNADFAIAYYAKNKTHYKGVFATDFDAEGAIRKIIGIYGTKECPECEALKHNIKVAN